MKPDQNTPLADFWLHQATSALCDQARARIAVEVRSHYADLVEAHVAEGMPLVDARIKALEDLGDAKVAARRFRKQHLTKGEEKWISAIVEFNRGRILAGNILCFLSLFYLILGLELIPSRFKIELGVAGILTLVALPVGVCILARRAKSESRLSTALLYDMAAKIAGLLFFIILFSRLDVRPPRIWGWMIFLLCLFQFGNAVSSYRLWRKFHREQKRHSEALNVG